jgi:hypothetical protein
VKKTLTALAAAVFVALVSGCNIETSFDDESVGYESYLQSDGYTLLELENKAGNVTVTASDVDSICIDYTMKAKGITTSIFPHDYSRDIDVTFDADKENGAIKITVDYPDNPDINYSVDFEIKLPEDMELEIVNGAGNVTVIGMAQKPKKLELATGNLILKALKCGAYARVGIGNLDCDIANLPSNESVDLNAVMGNTSLKISAMDATNSLKVIGTSGNADVTLPASVELAFDVSVTTGTVSINGYTPEQGSPWTDVHKVGTLGVKAVKSTLNVAVGTGNATLNKAD